MSEKLVLGCFAAALVACVLTGWPVLLALLAGLALFFAYGLSQRRSMAELWRAALDGIVSVRTVVITLALIGVLSGLWRVCGTIPLIVTYASRLLDPNGLLVATFLLCCLLSFFTGTSFGTAATVGVICMTMARSMGLSPVLMGGAILSGSFFGDRCSPVSTSALLVSSQTGTDLYANLRVMFRTAFVPFLASCLAYGVLGMTQSGTGAAQDSLALFAGFRLEPVLLLPAAAILVCALFHLDVRWTMLVSIALSAALAVIVQGTAPRALLYIMLTGFHPEDTALAAVLEGGGVLSMANVVCIVCISCAYSGLFRVTGLLDGIRRHIGRLSERIGPYASTLAASCGMALISCNQTLTILLTYQLCRDLEPDRTKLASYLEDSAVVVAPLVPWSIAAAVPLAAVSAPSASILAACFLYLLPVWRILVQPRRAGSAPHPAQQAAARQKAR